MTLHDHLVNDLAAQINALQSSPILRVGIDGEAGAGKTTLANELRERLESLGRNSTAGFNRELDQPVDGPTLRANHGDILLFDGIFLHRPELISYWDFSIFLDVDLPIIMERNAQRDGPKVLPPDAATLDPNTIENWRYVEGQRIYVRNHRPQQAASTLIDCNDLNNPCVVKAQNL